MTGARARLDTRRLARPRPKADPEAEPDDLAVRSDLREMRRYCRQFAGRPGAPTTGSGPLTPWEKGFIWSLAVQGRPLSHKQISILIKIYRSCQCWEFCGFPV
jgi:hypothetical protein